MWRDTCCPPLPEEDREVVMVPTASLVCMGAAALAAFALPVVLIVVGRRRWRFSARSCVVGALAFVIFALILESATHAAVFAALPAVQRSVALYTLYGALAAGIFEELGRVCGFALLRRIDRGPDGIERAIGAGVGHGGIEAVVVAGFGMVTGIVLSVTVVNAGTADSFLSQLPEALRGGYAQRLDALVATPAPLYLLGIGERVIAIALHVALSVLVWMAFSGRIGRWWILGAVLAHALCDVGAALYQGGAISVFAAEGWALLTTCAVVALVRRLYTSTQTGGEGGAEPAP
ncbi:putative membrane peptidase [Schaalia georgiae F0490]|uniref:Putative membrane peptidase n=2 Tax=Schaalia georgiae TaxID=52768 RepID=J0XM69_9ACTO|nr:putative membrane peptidase [Schaalia georgiae F0490]